MQVTGFECYNISDDKVTVEISDRYIINILTGRKQGGITMYNKKFQKTVVAVIAGIIILTMVISTIAVAL